MSFQFRSNTNSSTSLSTIIKCNTAAHAANAEIQQIQHHHGQLHSAASTTGDVDNLPEQHSMEFPQPPQQEINTGGMLYQQTIAERDTSTIFLR